jgi:hypothetical protein
VLGVASERVGWSRGEAGELTTESIQAGSEYSALPAPKCRVASESSVVTAMENQNRRSRAIRAAGVRMDWRSGAAEWMVRPVNCLSLTVGWLTRRVASPRGRVT